jgi:glycosyltransferase involved in cell wall biosynthesis
VKKDNNNSPIVSILVPNYNMKEFLAERLHTILDQTLEDWELLILDSYSSDGSWELIQEITRGDKRVVLMQGSREGIYPAINKCVEKAKGEYIYIATSDDTMAPDCLEKMVKALEDHPECDICHCCLTIIDENGNVSTKRRWENWFAQKFYGELITKPHIRKAPLDGILYFSFNTIYSSLTQLLINKKVFDTVGPFKDDWGPAGDYEWGTKAALLFNTIHVPEYLATWRMHKNQATPSNQATSSGEIIDITERKREMIKSSLLFLEKNNPKFFKKLNLKRLNKIYEKIIFEIKSSRAYSLSDKLKFIFFYLFKNPVLIIEKILDRVLFRNYFYCNLTQIQKEIDKLGLKNNISIL